MIYEHITFPISQQSGKSPFSPSSQVQNISTKCNSELYLSAFVRTYENYTRQKKKPDVDAEILICDISDITE